MTAPDPKGPAAADRSDEQVEQSLYARREKIYPREVHGLYARLRTLGVLGLLGIYCAGTATRRSCWTCRRASSISFR
jgi:hypothetical protein